MTEPRRWMDDARGGLESALLRAGAEEQPSPRAVERTVLSVGAGAATLGVVGVAASAPVVASAATVSGLGAAGVVKLLAIGAVAGLASGGALLGVTTAVQHRAGNPVPALVTPVKAVASPAPLLPPAPVLVAPPPSAEPPVVAVAPPPPAPTSAPDQGTPLAAEVALVDRAHAALRSGDARSALATLERYEATFATPRLLPEVFALRMEAAEHLGDASAARLWAGRIVTHFPRSAQAPRARSLLEGSAEGDR